MTIWNKTPNEYECDECGAWSPLNTECWHCTLQRAQEEESATDDLPATIPAHALPALLELPARMVTL